MTYSEWLISPSAIRCILVEAVASIADVETTLYFSNLGYTTTGTDTPVNTAYEPIISGGISINESLSLDRSSGLSYGDIELLNYNGDYDELLGHVWTNRAINVYFGDITWPRSDFQLVFSGIINNIDSSTKDKLNIKIRDKLERLNTPITDTKLGGTTDNKELLKPLTFGEVSNIQPLLIDPAQHQYQVHDGAIEGIIEVRDNGVPVSTTDSLSTGTFKLNASPAGTITASVQGAKPVTYYNTISQIIQQIVLNWGKASTRFTTADLDTSNLSTFDTAHTQPIGVYLSERTNIINVIQDLAASVGAQVSMSRTGLLRLLEIKSSPTGTPIDIGASDMVQGTFHIVFRTEVKSTIKIGYNKNWTVQTKLETGIPEASKALFEEEYRTITATDSAVATKYKLDAEPVERDTMLQATTDATNEAQRELNIYKVPRTIYEFTGFANLLELDLGSAVTLTHARYGLSGGALGTVVNLAPNWLDGTVKVQVFV